MGLGVGMRYGARWRRCVTSLTFLAGGEGAIVRLGRLAMPDAPVPAAPLLPAPDFLAS
jgi:hypothetical protein